MPKYTVKHRDEGEEPEARPRVVRKPEEQKLLECPVDGCGESRGRVERVEIFPGDSASIGLRCSQGHYWWMSIDERGGELVYTVKASRVWPTSEELLG